MKSLQFALAVGCVALSAQIALAQGTAPAWFQQVVEINVKPGQELAFENYIKKLVAAGDKLGAKQTWTTAKFKPAYQAATGQPGVGRSVLRMGQFSA